MNDYIRKASITWILLTIAVVSIIQAIPKYVPTKTVETEAITTEGRNVRLYTDGTWEYWERAQKQSLPKKQSKPNHKY